jgi:hypothetical protein
MFVYGAKGRKAPYAISVITQMQLSALFLNSNLFLIKSKKKIPSFTIKSLSFFGFSDTAKN